MVLPIISEEDYLAHYGRKGMKWYQHIYGDKYGYKNLNRKQKKQVNKTAKSDARQVKNYKDALMNEYDIKSAFEKYRQTGSEKDYKKLQKTLKKSQEISKKIIDSMDVLKESYKDLSKSLGAKGEERLKKMYHLHVISIENIGSMVWDDKYNSDMQGVRKKKN